VYMKVFSYGTGSGNAAIHYLIRTDYPGREKNAPEVVRGDPDQVLTIINSLDTKWKFTSGVLSWHPDDMVSLQQEEKVIEDFERIAFAGLDRDAYSILWVRHSHAGHHELHFVIPRVELTTGKAFNPCPPGWQKDFDVFRDLHNIRENWARPDDPARRRLHTPEHAEIFTARLLHWGKKLARDERAEAKTAIHQYVEKLLAEDLIQNRQDILAALQEIGFTINRAGKDYITVKDPNSGEKIRLKGGIYGESWSFTGAHELSGGKITGQDRTDPAENRNNDLRSVQTLEREFERIITKRSKYNRGRYRPRDRGDAITIDFQLQHGEPALLQQVVANVPAGVGRVDWVYSRRLGIDGLYGQSGPGVESGNLHVEPGKGYRTTNPHQPAPQDMGNTVSDHRRQEVHHSRPGDKSSDDSNHQRRATSLGNKVKEEGYDRVGTIYSTFTNRMETEFRDGDSSSINGNGRVGEKNSDPGSPTCSNRGSFTRIAELIDGLRATIEAFERRIAEKIVRIGKSRGSGMRR
jgi:hypothetical protein